MNATDIIGWTADADYWCDECAELVYGPESDDRKDGEGNDVHPIFASDETPAGSVCGRCSREITDPAEVDIWALLEQIPPDGCEAIQDLYSWSLNFDAGKGPFALFLDIVGWSEENIGEAIYNTSQPVIGYVEAAKLGAALTEYADRPHDVMTYVERLMTAEGR